MIKRKKRGEKNQYFDTREQQALVKYIKSESIAERHKLYLDILHVPFKLMAEIILKRYPINIGNYEIEDIQAFAVSHLVEKMVGYKEDVNSKHGGKAKAFGYCGTIIRNYYKDWHKNMNKERVRNLSFEDYHEEVEKNTEYMYEIDTADDHDMKVVLINRIIDKIRNKIDTDKTLKKNEIIVGEAIINILVNWHLLFLEDTEQGVYNKKVSNSFAKNKILLFLKEQTDLSTKEIRSSMRQYKELYILQKNQLISEE